MLTTALQDVEVTRPLGEVVDLNEAEQSPEHLAVPENKEELTKQRRCVRKTRQPSQQGLGQVRGDERVNTEVNTIL